MVAHLWRLCRHAWYRLPQSRPGHGWSMRGVVVPSPTRPAHLRAWYSGDRFPIISCLCRSQLWCPRRGVPAQGAHISGQVGAACAARHDIPHRTHHQRVWPGGSGRRVKCSRMPGTDSAVSSGKTIRPGTPATGGLVRRPRLWPLPVLRRSGAGCGGSACSATLASHSLFPTTSVASRPGHPLPGLGAPTCPSPFPGGTRGGRYDLSTDRTGRELVVGPGSPPRPHTRATARPGTHTFSGGGGCLLAGNPGVGPPFGQPRAHGGGRIIIINVKGVVGKSVMWRGGREQGVTAQREHTEEASGGHVMPPPSPPLPARHQPGRGGVRPGEGPASPRPDGGSGDGEGGAQ